MLRASSWLGRCQPLDVRCRERDKDQSRFKFLHALLGSAQEFDFDKGEGMIVTVNYVVFDAIVARIGFSDRE